MNEADKIEERIARVRADAEGINVRIRQAEMRLGEFAFIACEADPLNWDPKARAIRIGLVPALSLTYEARTRLCTPKALEALTVAALVQMEKSLGHCCNE